MGSDPTPCSFSRSRWCQSKTNSRRLVLQSEEALMISMRSQFALVLIVMALLCLPAEGWAQNSQVQGQAAVASATPTLPDDLGQVPSGKSDVTYVNGQLTIRAHNAPLIEVVR